MRTRRLSATISGASSTPEHESCSLHPANHGGKFASNRLEPFSQHRSALTRTRRHVVPFDDIEHGGRHRARVGVAGEGARVVLVEPFDVPPPVDERGRDLRHAAPQRLAEKVAGAGHAREGGEARRSGRGRTGSHRESAGTRSWPSRFSNEGLTHVTPPSPRIGSAMAHTMRLNRTSSSITCPSRHDECGNGELGLAQDAIEVDITVRRQEDRFRAVSSARRWRETGGAATGRGHPGWSREMPRQSRGPAAAPCAARSRRAR